MAEPRAHRRVWWDRLHADPRLALPSSRSPRGTFPRSATRRTTTTSRSSTRSSTSSLKTTGSGSGLSSWATLRSPRLPPPPPPPTPPPPPPSPALLPLLPLLSLLCLRLRLRLPVGRRPGLFTDWRDAAQLGSWRRMVAAVASRYVGRYGVAVVKRWRWEGWNALQDEPDHHCNTTWCTHVIHRTRLYGLYSSPLDMPEVQW